MCDLYAVSSPPRRHDLQWAVVSALLASIWGITPVAASVKFEAESGIIGTSFSTSSSSGVNYISNTNNSTATAPEIPQRVVSYNVSFPNAGTYELYARVRVGPGGSADDSFFYGSGFGDKSPAVDVDWVLVNSVNSGGFTAPGDAVTGSGSAGINVWKWINLSRYTGTSGDPPISFTVTESNLSQTFEIGGREDGFDIDAFVFGLSGLVFTVADLDAGTDGNPPQCTVNWDDLRQRVDGFGGGVQFLNPGSLDPVPNSVMNTLFGTNANQLALTLLRIGIDPVNWNNNQLLDAQKAVARGAGIIATPWTPPASMKDNGNRIGGSLLPSQYSNYATYLNDFAGFMAANDAPLKVISIQNEPDIQVSYDSCDWTPGQLQTFCRDVGGLITNAPLMMPESFNFNFAVSDPTLNDPAAAANVDYIGGHLYGVNTIFNYANAHNKGKPVWMTEYLINDQTIETAIETAKQIHDCLTTANMSAYIWWKAYGDANGVVNASGVPQRRGFVLSQWSAFVRPNDYRIGTLNTGLGFVSAYKNTNSSQFAIVAINTSDTSVEQMFVLEDCPPVGVVTPWITSSNLSRAALPPVTVSNAAFRYSLAPLSVTTFVGRPASNTPPALAPVPHQTINAGVTLVVTNVATDTDLPPQALTISLLNSSPTNATLNPSTGVLMWRPFVNQADTTNQFAVRVEDDGTPSLSATNNFQVTVNPLMQPEFTSIAVLTDGVNLIVDGDAGPDYGVLTSTNLMNWEMLLVTNPSVLPFSLIDTNSRDPHRYYQLQLGP